MEAEAFSHQEHTYQHNETQGQDLQRRETFDEGSDIAAGEHHHQHGHCHGCNDHHNHVGHANRRHDGIKREHNIDQHHLRHHGQHTAGDCLDLFFFVACHLIMDAVGALIQQETTAQQHQDILARQVLPEQRDPGLLQADDPGDAQQQQDTHHKRQRQAHEARALALLFRQVANQKRDENNVINTEDDLKCGQGQKAYPYVIVE